MRENNNWAMKLAALLDTVQSVTNAEQDEVLFDRVAQIAYFLDLNGGGMVQEHRERGGPVLKGDECLSGAAMLLNLVAQAYPTDSPAYRQTMNRAERYYREMLKYYPDSPFEKDAQDFLDAL